VVEEWLETAKPDMVVINLSSNDTVGKPNRFEASIRAMVERTLEVGARPVLIQEPRVEKMGRLGLNHETLRRVAADHGIPVIELMPTLRRAAASGFLWWDPVHLTSYGQAIVAEQLSTHLQPLLTDARGVD
jgi:lysophospholipase L1-like esterase